MTENNIEDKTEDKTKDKSKAKSDKQARPHFDLILYGATSFVGKIMVEYLASLPSDEVKWAIAARDEAKLKALKAEFSLSDKITHFVADAQDEEALKKICQQTKVIVTTVGPYALFGETMLKVCAQSGTDYCDLTGEPQWIKKMLDKYEQDAKESGARIINCAGFDSIPSDLGVYYTQQLAIERTGKPAKQIKMRVRKIKGGASGGTVASLLNVLKEADSDASLKKLLVNPYMLCPQNHDFHVRQKNHKKAEYDEQLGIWTMPFVMAAINERVIHRSNALLNNRYGTDFKYDEAMSAKKASTAWTTALGLGAFVAAASISPIRSLLEKYVLPKPGEGPSKKEQLEGMFDMRFYASLKDEDKSDSQDMSDNAQILQVQVIGDRDPGYGATAKMLTQAALCLANDVESLEGGFWTPAAALGDHLIERLAQHAGVKVSRVDY
uniref:saccharopine dehydrogenase family protein n=1 Tax=Ningiella ruwaisensis TaxID=2364274 RepID=UPI00109F22F9|nr:saccharopine dehydrogenase NADP-binding domain-containing protein [Ningiella ruwaisensis]